jgi:folate-binding protein YgfZ
MTSTPVSGLVPTDTVDIAGRLVARHYGDSLAEYSALRAGSIVVDRSFRTRTTFAGSAAGDTLTGLLTNDVKALPVGHGQYAAALTPKGKIIADVRLFVRESDILVDVPPRAADGWWSMVRKYVNPRVSRFIDQTDDIADIGVFGATARAVVRQAIELADPGALGGFASYSHVTGQADGAPVTLIRVPDLDVEGYELLIERAAAPALWNRLVAAGAVPAGLDAWDIGRIEAGRPEWGIDIDDTTIPQEANLDELHAISYTKGCYTGQETVARVHFRGHVNRHLRGLRFDDLHVPSKAQLFDAAGKLVGDVRSVAVSPRLGGIALAMVRREIALDSSVRAAWPDGEAMVRVTALPIAA